MNDNSGAASIFVREATAMLREINRMFGECRPLIVHMEGKEYVADIVGAVPSNWSDMFTSRTERP